MLYKRKRSCISCCLSVVPVPVVPILPLEFTQSIHTENVVLLDTVLLQYIIHPVYSYGKCCPIRYYYSIYFRMLYERKKSCCVRGAGSCCTDTPFRIHLVYSYGKCRHIRYYRYYSTVNPIFQDVVRKKKELLCPECRFLVTVDIDFLPPNILVNRILEVSLHQPFPPSPPLPTYRTEKKSKYLRHKQSLFSVC
jgi:hypothetical protein